MKTADIRSAFLEYFREKEHRVVPSASLVPHDDPTLLFVNAGMVPFKDIFTGRAPKESPRAASSQRCLRVSGKHNDLEEVGRTPRHHTLFEMLGNFSFGDYFKEEAVAFAWELLTDRLGLDPGRLAVTVFGGEDGVPEDTEAAGLWHRVTGIPEDRILRFGAKDNFWSMGDTGPCGPCSEIHYDLGPELEGEVNRGDRWMEIWNLVFMQYDRGPDGTLASLPAPSIDTGMGLERIASVVQGKLTNYDTDLFRALLERVSQLAGRPYAADASDDAVSQRVIADHARATAFLLSDGVHPDKTGRGYVLRKIMRRAISHGVLLGVEKDLLPDACAAVAEVMGAAYPELPERLDSIRAEAGREERLFRRTVEEGMRRIDDLLGQLENDEVWTTGPEGERTLKGDVAFRLYDTYGCPLELTASVGVRRRFEVDEAGFFAAMAEQKERSRASWKGGGVGGAGLDILVRGGTPVPTKFTGYDTLADESVVRQLAVAQGDSLVPADRADEGASVALVTVVTPFYGESGGQVGDTGEFVAEGGRVVIEDTRKVAGGDVFVHLGTVEEGEIGPGARVAQRVDAVRRSHVTGHHSATHLLHHALREVLGPHVQQKGSWVGPDRLRFDFSHPEPVRADELARIEERVNEMIRANHDVTAEILSYDEAIAAGALAFFGDKYGDEVRMVTMGPSRELCGGTHVGLTGDLGVLTFASEGSVASGVRRVEAFAGPAALESVRGTRERLERLADALKSSPEEAERKLADLQEETKRLRRRVEELERDAAGSAAEGLAGSAREVAGHRLVCGRAPVESRDALRELGDSLRATPNTVVVLGAEMDGKVALLAALSDDVVKGGKLKAGDLVGRVARVAGGGGGGKPHLATAGAKDPARLGEALEAVPVILSELAGA
jgi:alanyl-tRNA synthetase